MALFKTKQAVKYEKKHLLGIQDLSIPEIVHILNESQSFVELNRKENKKLSLLKGRHKLIYSLKVLPELCHHSNSQVNALVLM